MKVTSIYREKHKTANGHIWSTQYEKVPAIRISGKWLTKIGFNCGDNYTLITKNNELIIRKEN